MTEQHYIVVRTDWDDGEAYWVLAPDEDTARRAVAANTDARDATDPTKYQCRPDNNKQPPAGMIYRRLHGPLAVEQ
ncbi:hypothetical protein [Dongia sedimenti]|uniref:DUF2188 domain-containing protein n=1 Tax=Dongia sedimenti TaxID=3064282 RepID=A0ABU0YYB5_9PROT|nr:hypothetical protein [Rhodospirillaceae bacterium R-7]